MTSLTLHCPLDQRVMVGTEVVVRVDNISSKSVSLTFDAPIEMSIDTEENRINKMKRGLDVNDSLAVRTPKEEKVLTLDDISDHIKGVANVHAKEKNESKTIRLLKLVKDLRFLEDNTLLAIVQAINSPKVA